MEIARIPVRCQFRRLPVYFMSMAKQSSLNDFHRTNGALFGEQHGWLVPSHFGDVLGEYDAVRSGAGLLDFSIADCFNSLDRIACRFCKACYPMI